MKNTVKSLSVIIAFVLLFSALQISYMTAYAAKPEFKNGEAGISSTGAGSDIVFDKYSCVEYLEGLGVDINSLHKTIEDGLKQCKSRVDIAKYKIPDGTGLNALKAYFIGYFPDYYYFCLEERFYYSTTNYVTELIFIYGKGADTPAGMKSLLSQVNSLLDGIRGNTALSDAEKALLVHDRLALNLDYDYDEYYGIKYDDDSYTAYGALIKHKAVCQGYSLAYEYLMNTIGIKTGFVAAEKFPHAWNVVYIDNKPYYVDVTWDDYYGGVIHNNFLRSAKGFIETDHDLSAEEHYFDGVPVSDTRYDDYYWQNSNAPFQLVNNKIYYVDNNAGTLNKADKNKTVLFNIGSQDDNASLCVFNNNLIFSHSGQAYKVDTSKDKVSSNQITSISDLGKSSISGAVGDCVWSLKGTALTISGNDTGCYCYIEMPLRLLVKSVSIADSVTEITRNSLSFYKIKSISISDKVTSIGDSAFEYCDLLESVTIPNSVKSLGECSFLCCKSLKNAVLPNAITAILDYTFYECESLKNVNIPKNVITIGKYAFFDCKKISEVIIPDKVTNIGDSSFAGCSGITKLEIGKSVKTIDDAAFFACSKLDYVFIPACVKKIGDKAFDCDIYGVKGSEAERYVNNSNNPFATFIPLEVEISEKTGWNWKLSKDFCLTISGNGTIENPAKQNYLGMKVLPWGNKVKKVVINSGITAIGANAFEDNTKLESVTISSGIKSIGEEAFLGCDNLKSITIPKSITSIGEHSLGYSLEGDNLFDGGFNWDSLGDMGWGIFDWYNDFYKKVDGFVIYGYIGSEAQRYADENDFTFKSLDTAVKLSECAFTLSYNSTTYNGNKKTPAVTVKKGTKKLIKGTDYTVSYKNNIDAGTATVTIKGKGIYTGTKTVNFTIKKASLSDADIALSYASTTYNGNKKTPKATVTLGSKTLTKNTDYTVAYKNNINAGTATVTITGKGNYTGTKTASFTIKKASIEKYSAALSYNSVKYSGSAKKPAVTVKTGSVSLKSGTDYTVTYKNNTGIGKATVTIAGKGNYSGTITKTFKITPANVTNLKAASVAKTSVKLSWTKVSNAQGYYVYKYISSTGKWSKVATVSSASATVSSLTKNTSYKFAVKAYKTVSGTTYLSPAYTSISVTTAK